MSSCEYIEVHLVDYLDEALDPSTCRELDRHLASCTPCMETVRSYREISAAYRDGPGEDVSSDVAARILERAGAESSRSRRPRSLVLVLAAAAAILVIWSTRGLIQSTSDRKLDPIADLIQEADEFREDGEFERALQLYKRAERIAGDGEHAAKLLHRLADVLIATGAYERAADRLDVLAARFPDYGERKAILLLHGELLVQRGELGRAIQAYQAIAHEFPEDTSEAESRLRYLELATIEADDEDYTQLEALGYLGD